MCSNPVEVKVFRDPVHGYIEVPKIIVKKIIDTEQFQRLKFIEQTSMRALFPAARHDRFIHSLGTYWLGVKAFEGFKKNSDPVVKNLKTRFRDDPNLLFLSDDWWKKYELLFQIACLMHDCAHAPFSHTLEDYYKTPIEHVGALAYTKLSWLLCSICTELGDDSFKEDFYEVPGETVNTGIGNPHEQMSSLLILREYLTPIEEICTEILGKPLKKNEYIFICRAIIGCKYSEESPENSLKNCIISLLNSDLIDVDGLDYTVRDAQMSGMSAYDIDYRRLLNSFTILPVSVYKDVDIKDKNIDGLWLRDSEFNVSFMKQCEVNTAVSVAPRNHVYENRFQDFEIGKAYYFDPGRNKKTRARIDCAGDFNMHLINSGRLKDTLISGKIVDGKRIIEKESNEDKGRPIAFVLAYDKRCLSIIQNTLNARNDAYLWVYSHPKVMYCSNYLQCELLKLSAKYLCCKCNNMIQSGEKLAFNCDSCDFCKNKKGYEFYITHILGYDFLLDRPEDKTITDMLQQKGFYFYRTNDDDLNALFKRIKLENELLGEKKSDRIEKLCNEYFSRKQRCVLWKSFAEYTAIYMMFNENRNLEKLFEQYETKLEGKNEKYIYLDDSNCSLFEKYGLSDILVIFGRSKTKSISESEFFVKYEDRVEQLGNLFDANMLKGRTDLPLKFMFADAREEWNYQTLRDINDSLSVNDNL